LAYCIESNAIYLLILLKSDVVVLSEQKVLENRTVFYACSVELLVNMMFMVLKFRHFLLWVSTARDQRSVSGTG